MKYMSNVLILIVLLNLAPADMDKLETKLDAIKSYGSLLKNLIDVNEKRIAYLKKINELQDFIITKNSLANIHDLDDEELRYNDPETDQRDDLTLIDRHLKMKRTYINYQQSPSTNMNFIPSIIPFNSYKTEDNYKKYDNKDTLDRYSTFYVHNTILENIHDAIDYSKMQVNFDKTYKIDDKIKDPKIEFENNENTVEENTDLRRRRQKRCGGKVAAKVCKRACVSAHRNGCRIFECSRRALRYFDNECRNICSDKFVYGRYSDSDSE